MLKVFTSHRCLAHRVPLGFPERPERLEGVLAGLASGPWPLEEIERHAGAAAAVAALHEPGYVERFERAARRGDALLDTADNPIVPATWSAAWAAVETTLAAVDWMCSASDRRAFAAVRPPGHHAERAMAMGFCFFNNVAVAAQYLRLHHGRSRVAIVDFDVHHGNGTQHLLEERSDVLFVSTHQYPFYPGSGAASERGVGAGEGFTLNVPLPAGADDGDLEEALTGLVLPAVRRFEPEALLVSAGFDAWQNDPLGGLRWTAEGFARCGSLLGGLADELCQGQALAVLEGGYDLDALPRLVRVFLEGFERGLSLP